MVHPADPNLPAYIDAVEQYNKEIDEAMARIDAGEYINHEDLENEAERW